MEQITLHDKIFMRFIPEKEIQEIIKKMAESLYQAYKDEIPVFIGVLNGVIMFMTDFLKHYPGKCEVDFMKLSSYQGTQSKGEVINQLDISIEINNRHVVILEDIIDTGNTLEKLCKLLKNKPTKSIKIATLFFKPEVFKKKLIIDVIGKNIPNKFVVGYGLDYDGLGRNYKDLYQLKE